MLNKDCTTCAIIQYCSTQDMLYMSSEYRKFRRVHGLQLPLHPQQIIGWMLLIVIFAGTFTILLITPLFSNLHFILLLLFATLFLLHVLTHLTVLLLDPADPEVRARPTSEIVPEFDRTKHRHVIENDRCHLCNITTYGRHIKHCSICNKCVPRFDHHCKWLNNCIGGRNYPAFLACLVSTLITALSVTAFALGELVLVNVCFVVDNEHWKNNNSNGTDMNTTTPSASLLIPGTGSLILITIIGILSTVAAVLLIHLCFFHGYIACLGLTTYEYMRRKRERNVTSNIISSRIASSSNLSASYCTDNNGEDCVDQMVSTQSLYSCLCEKGSFRVDTGTTATTDMFVCSVHEKTCGTTNGKNISMKTFSSTKSSRNFHLCFSYDARTETSVEVSSSRTTNMMESKNHKELLDAKSSSTPSPVSCCFSIMNHSENRHDRNGRKRRTSEHRSETAKRSCGTMRRIQTFLQIRLRKSSKQKSMIPLSVARHCGNKVIPQTDSSPDITPTIIEDQNQSHLVETLTTELGMLPYNLRPARLPALDLPRVIHNIKEISPSSGDISIPMISSSMISKRNQTHLCTRRNASLSRKRPRFKLGSHIIAQTAQLSPIPESEFSKPATPRSPSRSSPAFIFPSLRE